MSEPYLTLKMAFKKGNIPWTKGRKLSKEHKERIGKAGLGNKSRTGMKNSEESKKKISDSLMKLSREGKLIHWSKTEKRDKIIEKTMATKRKNNTVSMKFWLNKKRSEETKKKISESKKGTNLGEKNPFFGKHHSLETKEMISKKNKGKKSWIKGLTKETDERVAKIHESRKGYKHSDETKEKLRQATIKQLKSGSMLTKDTSIEKKMEQKLKELDIDYEKQKVFKLGISDFFVYPNIYIFCDGDYWHNYPHGKPRDEKQIEYLNSNDCVGLRFWEHDINNNIDFCANTIQGEIK